MSFDEKVWQLIKKIPKGRVATYAGIAAALGNPHAARAVGNACNRSPSAPSVPCHRVVLSNGRVGGYANGANKKIALLRKEGIAVKNWKVLGFKHRLFQFK